MGLHIEIQSFIYSCLWNVLIDVGCCVISLLHNSTNLSAPDSDSDFIFMKLTHGPKDVQKADLLILTML